MSDDDFWQNLADAANERAERYSEVAEWAEQFARAAEEASKVEDESVGRSTWTDDGGVEHATEVTLTVEDDEDGPTFVGDIEEFTFTNDLDDAARPVHEPLEYEGEFSFTIGGESNVECPEWLSFPDGYPDGVLQCPHCDQVGLSYSIDRNLQRYCSAVSGHTEVSQSPEFHLWCQHCDSWYSECYTFEDAWDAFRIAQVADKIR